MPKWIIKIYTIYAVVLFAALGLVALFFYILVRLLIPYRHQIKWVYGINKSIMSIWIPLTGYRFEITGAHFADPSKNYIVIVNHQNSLDMFTVARHLKIAGKPLIKIELLRIPILGWLFSMAAFPVRRENKESRNASYSKMIKEVSKGMSLLIFPEGTRNRTDQPLIGFKDGAFRIAVETGLPILPVLIMNIRNLASEKPVKLIPGKIYLHYLEPVDPGLFEGNVEKLKAHCHDIMQKTILQYDPYFKTI